MKKELSQLTDAEIEALGAELNQLKPWATPGYKLVFFLRRWMLTLWCGYGLFFLELSYSHKIFIFLLTVLFDVVSTPRRSWDLKTDISQILKNVRDRHSEVRSPTMTLVIGTVVFAAICAYPAIDKTFNLVLPSINRLEMLILTLLFLTWLSLDGIKNISSRDMLFLKSDKAEVPRTIQIWSFMGGVPYLQTVTIKIEVSFSILYFLSSLFLTFGILSIPETLSAVNNSIILSASLGVIFALIHCSFLRTMWWMKLRKINSFVENRFD